MKINLLLILAFAFLLTSCGGGSSNKKANGIDATLEANKQVSVGTNLGDTVVKATGNRPTKIKITDGIDKQGNVEIQIDISGGSAEIILPETPSYSKKVRVENRKVLSKNTTDSVYPIIETMESYPAWFVSGVSKLSNITDVDIIKEARLNERVLTHKDEAELEHANFTASFQEASRLMSVCGVTDLNVCGHKDKVPVLLIHGFQKELLGPNLDSNNGGEGYWGEFPNKLLNDGYVPFEFRWSSNSRFEDVAHDLAKAINSIYLTTGNKKVHIVAHSFGGLLLRTLLQVGPHKASADHYNTHYSDASIESMLATTTTVGSPHSGIADGFKMMHGKNFPQGQDHDGLDVFEGCEQLSCHLMGEDVLNSYLAGVFHVANEAGEWALRLSETRNNLPSTNMQVLIGFAAKKSSPITTLGTIELHTAFGDLLISGYGQRFYPNLSLLGDTEVWVPLLNEATIGDAFVSEFILGRKYDNDSNNSLIQSLSPDKKLQWSFNPLYTGSQTLPSADITNFDIIYVPYKHSGGTIGYPNSMHYSEEVCVGCGDEGSSYHDTYQRVFDWMHNKIICETGETVSSNTEGAEYCFVQDTISPVITITGSVNYTIVVGEQYNELGATASDNIDTTIIVEIDNSAVNTSIIGTYSVYYNAKDSSGNIADTKIRTVNVVAETVIDSTPPVITISGNQTITISKGTSYSDAGATATDNIDGNVNVVKTGSVNSQVVGTYHITYTAIDSANNVSTKVRTVHVTDTITTSDSYMGSHPNEKLASTDCKAKDYQGWKDSKNSLIYTLAPADKMMKSIEGCIDVKQLTELGGLSFAKAVESVVRMQNKEKSPFSDAFDSSATVTGTTDDSADDISGQQDAFAAYNVLIQQNTVSSCKAKYGQYSFFELATIAATPRAEDIAVGQPINGDASYCQTLLLQSGDITP